LRERLVVEMARLGFKRRVEMAKNIAKVQKEVSVSELAVMLDCSPQYAYQIAKTIKDINDEFEFDGHVLRYVGTDEKGGEEHGMEAHQ
jgi:hypothetical protein